MLYFWTFAIAPKKIPLANKGQGRMKGQFVNATVAATSKELCLTIIEPIPTRSCGITWKTVVLTDTN